MLYLDAQPNAAHKKLAEWEAAGKLKAVNVRITAGLLAALRAAPLSVSIR